MDTVALQAVIRHQHVKLDRCRRHHQLAAAIDDQLVLDPFLEVEFLLELLLPVRIVRFHLALFPDAEGMGRVDMRNGQGFR